jgi:hypothetical protein
MGDENVFFRPEELQFFDSINAEVPRLVAPRAKYFIKILPTVTQDEPRFEKDVLYGEQKRNWRFAGPLIVPIHMETPTEPKEFEENRGGSKDLDATAYLSRKLFEDSVHEELAVKIISARGAIVPETGDVIAIWTTHEGSIAFWDVENVERDQYLGDLPLHLQWRLTLHRRTRYASERAFGIDLEPKEPIVIISAEDFESKISPFSVRPEKPEEGKLTPDEIEKRALGR